jgi:1-acyl-sn-glycerol-3-phosphate acyltransferase
MNVYGLENFEATTPERPLLLAANHRSFFDMYAVSSVLFRRTKRPLTLFFPVRAQFFYESLIGVLINMFAGWWSMYPPIFAEESPEKRPFDKYSVRRLTQLSRNGRGHVIGFHPEGTRNLNSDPYTFLRAQPGIGKIIKEAAPQVVPVFIAGLGNKPLRQIRDNWSGGEPIRIYFGPPLDLSDFMVRPDRVRTYKEIADFVMSKVAELGEIDRTEMSKVTTSKVQGPESKGTTSNVQGPKSKVTTSKVQGPKSKVTTSKVQGPKSKVTTSKVQGPKSKV